MLDMGFAEDIEAILDGDARTTRQTVLFSATMPPRIDAHRPPPPARPGAHRDRPRGRAAGRGARGPPDAPTSSPRAHKPAALGRILDVEAPTAAIVFCRTRDEVDELTETLNGRGYRAEALHGGMTQEQRDRVMGRLRGGHRRPARRHRRRRPRPRHRPAHPRRQLRRARRRRRPTCTASAASAAPGARASRSRSPSRASTACSRHRAGHQAADRDREGADGRRPARPPAGAHPRRAARRSCVEDDLDALPRRRRDARRASSTSMEVAARRGEARPRGRGHRGRREGDPRRRARAVARAGSRAGPTRPSWWHRRAAGAGAGRGGWLPRAARAAPGGSAAARRRPPAAPRGQGAHGSERRHDAPLHRRRARARHPPAGPRRRDRQRGRPERTRRSARSRSPTASRWSRCPRRRPTRSSPRCAGGRSRARRRRCVVSALAPSRGIALPEQRAASRSGDTLPPIALESSRTRSGELR